MIDITERVEALRARMHAAPPRDMTPAAVDAWFAANHATILAEIFASSSGRAYRVGGEWFVDTETLQAIAAQGRTSRTPSGWLIADHDASIECVRVDAPATLPGQRGALYQCVGGRAKAEQFLAGDARMLLAGSFDAWPERTREPPRATGAKHCACTIASGSCGCAGKPGKTSPRGSRPEDILQSAGLLDAGESILRLHDLAVYRPADAVARTRAVRALTEAGLRPRLRNGRVVVRASASASPPPPESTDPQPPAEPVSEPSSVSTTDAAAAVDALDRTRRALLCCLYGTSDREHLARALALEVPSALAGEVVAAGAGKAVVAELIRLHLDAYVDQVDADHRSELPADAYPVPDVDARRLADWAERFGALRYNRERVAPRDLAQVALRVGATYDRRRDPEGHDLLDDLRIAYRPHEELLDDWYAIELVARLARDLIRADPPRVQPAPVASDTAEHRARMIEWITRFTAFLQRYPESRVRARQLVDMTMAGMGQYDASEDPDGDELWHALAHAAYWLDDALSAEGAHEDFADLARDLIIRNSATRGAAKGEQP